MLFKTSLLLLVLLATGAFARNTKQRKNRIRRKLQKKGEGTKDIVLRFDNFGLDSRRDTFNYGTKAAGPNYGTKGMILPVEDTENIAMGSTWIESGKLQNAFLEDVGYYHVLCTIVKGRELYGDDENFEQDYIIGAYVTCDTRLCAEIDPVDDVSCVDLRGTTSARWLPSGRLFTMDSFDATISSGTGVFWGAAGWGILDFDDWDQDSASVVSAIIPVVNDELLENEFDVRSRGRKRRHRRLQRTLTGQTEL